MATVGSTPQCDANGADRLTYRVNDGGMCPAVADITTEPVNDRPSLNPVNSRSTRVSCWCSNSRVKTSTVTRYGIASSSLPVEAAWSVPCPT